MSRASFLHTPAVPRRPGACDRECENQANSFPRSGKKRERKQTRPAPGSRARAGDSAAADPVVRVPRRVLDLIPLLLRRASGRVPAALEVRLDLFEPAIAVIRGR